MEDPCDDELHLPAVNEAVRGDFTCPPGSDPAVWEGINALKRAIDEMVQTLTRAHLAVVRLDGEVAALKGRVEAEEVALERLVGMVTDLAQKCAANFRNIEAALR